MISDNHQMSVKGVDGYVQERGMSREGMSRGGVTRGRGYVQRGFRDVCAKRGGYGTVRGLLGLCCSIETRDRIEIITITAVLFN